MVLTQMCWLFQSQGRGIQVYTYLTCKSFVTGDIKVDKVPLRVAVEQPGLELDPQMQWIRKSALACQVSCMHFNCPDACLRLP